MRPESDRRRLRAAAFSSAVFSFFRSGLFPDGPSPESGAGVSSAAAASPAAAEASSAASGGGAAFSVPSASGSDVFFRVISSGSIGSNSFLFSLLSLSILTSRPARPRNGGNERFLFVCGHAAGVAVDRTDRKDEQAHNDARPLDAEGVFDSMLGH